MNGLIFDLDGTLVDSLSDIAAAMNRVLRAHGAQEHPEESYREWIGEGAGRLVEQALPPALRARKMELLAALRADYGAHLVERTAPYAGISDMLVALAERGVPLAVLSNKPHELTVAVVRHLFAPVPFVGVLGQREGGPHKPDPSGAFELAERLGVAPQRCGFVGDMPVDMQTALAAGMTPIGVAWGLRSGAVLQESGAQHVLDHPAALLSLVS